ncbi:MAG TPA: FAD-dependent oxidoreductase [Pseudonocardiaceae bacterium]|nr:FAD-dependent oxidoreductase [Pseudonocardiaceae bacterium]
MLQRDLPDADAIAERIGRGGKLVVIGGGWIGAEPATSAREKGQEVTIIERSPLSAPSPR